jgi:hypothetical protein
VILAVSLSLAGWYALHNAQDLLAGLLDDVLASRGFTLQQLKFEPSRDGLSVPVIEVRSPTIHILIENMALLPYPSLGYILQAEALKITVLEGDETDGDAISLSQTQSTLLDYAAFLPDRGKIGLVQICTDECQSGTTSWSRTDSHLFIHSRLPDLAISAEVQLSTDRASLSIYGFGVHPMYSDTVVQLQNQLIVVDGNLHVQASDLIHPGEGFTAKVETALATADYHLTIPDTLSRKVLDALQGQIHLGVDAAATVELDAINLAVKDTLDITADLTAAGNNITLNQPLRLRLSDATYEADVLLESNARCSFSVIPLSAQCQIANITLRSSLPEYSLDASVSLSNASIGFAPGSRQPVLHGGLSLDAYDNTGSILRAEGDLSIVDEQLVTNFSNAAIFGADGFTVNLQHDLQHGNGILLAQQRNTILALQPLLHRFSATRTELQSGNWDSSLEMAWAQGRETSLSVLLTVEDLQFDAEGYKFDGGAINISLDGWPNLSSSPAATLSWETIDVGFPMEDVSMAFDFAISADTGEVRLHGKQLALRLFDGNAVSDDFAWDSVSKRGHLSLDLKQLSLNQILALEDEKLYSTGRLNGSVPIHINRGNLSIASGIVTAIDPGGFIRYEPNAAIQATMEDNAQMTVLVEALSDFNYHQLSSDLNYGEDGKMHAVVRLKGSNPSFQGGREVHFNLTLEENVATLLKSLRLGDDIVEQLDNRGKH